MDVLRTETGVRCFGNKDSKHMKEEREERD